IPVLEIVAAAARRRRVPRGTRIFNQGDEAVRAHAVIEGGVRISQTGADGGQVVLRFIGPGEIFGTVTLFTDGCYPADATALADTLEASWSEPELLDLMTRYPQIAINAVRIIGQRLQEMQNRTRELATPHLCTCAQAPAEGRQFPGLTRTAIGRQAQRCGPSATPSVIGGASIGRGLGRTANDGAVEGG